MKAYFYVSEPTQPFDPCSLEALVNSAMVKNAAYNITGFLCYQDVFIQYFEGDCKAVDALFDVLKKDPRHTILNYITFEDIDHRQFPTWRMKLIGRNALNQDCVEPLLYNKLARASGAVLEPANWRKQVWLAIEHIASQPGTTVG
ncbi:BLUF domain-containing protein [Thalassotalea euphylliae]|nr:BLUF domain-containing protein [Thalassotalea euphylliae]